MRMALAALQGQSENTFSDRIHAVKHGSHAKFFRIDSPFFIEHGIAHETGGNFLILRCLGKQITGDLFNDKLIVGHILI